LCIVDKGVSIDWPRDAVFGDTSQFRATPSVFIDCPCADQSHRINPSFADRLEHSSATSEQVNRQRENRLFVTPAVSDESIRAHFLTTDLKSSVP
jgi:hypothetical protein